MGAQSVSVSKRPPNLITPRATASKSGPPAGDPAAPKKLTSVLSQRYHLSGDHHLHYSNNIIH